MSYVLVWKNPAIDPGKTNVTVPVASTVSNASSLTFTGKGAANYGKVQQENLMRLLENFADSTAPLHPTVGQLWYDSGDALLKICTSTMPLSWRSLAGVHVTDAGDPTPNGPKVGDLWFERTGPLSGYLYVYNGLGRFPATQTSSGGWSQVWPVPQEAALRGEYDEVAALVGQLISTSVQGNGADSRLFSNLTSFAALDAQLDARFTLTPDNNISTSAPVDLNAQPYSGDWDQLLAAARWAVARLDLPTNFWQDLSPIPFVQDGRQAPSNLLTSYTASANEPRYPSMARRTNRRYGSVAMARMYAETINVLSAAVNNRYTICGISGNSGTNTSFAPDVAQWIHCRRQGAFTGGAGEVSTVFRWGNDDERNRFIFGGNAIEVAITHTPSASPSSADAALQAFLFKHMRFRITADRVRSLGGAAPFTLAIVPSLVGLKNLVESPSVQTLAVVTEGPVALTLQGVHASNQLTIFATINTPSGVTGATQVTYNIIKDCTAFGPADTDLFPSPNVYNASTDAASTSPVFANVPMVQPPIANFSASALTVSSGGTVALNWTGSGAPTLVEWDVNLDGVFEGTGNSYTTVPLTTPGTRYTVRVRATNAAGTDILTRPAYILVT